MLSDGDNIRTGDFRHTDLSLICGIQVDVIRSNTGSDTQPEILRRVHDFLGEVPRVERSRDQDLGIFDVLVELRTRSLFVRGDY